MKLCQKNLEFLMIFGDILVKKCRSHCMGMSLTMCVWVTEGKFYRRKQHTMHLELFNQTIVGTENNNQ